MKKCAPQHQLPCCPINLCNLQFRCTEACKISARCIMLFARERNQWGWISDWLYMHMLKLFSKKFTWESSGIVSEAENNLFSCILLIFSIMTYVYLPPMWFIRSQEYGRNFLHSPVDPANIKLCPNAPMCFPNAPFLPILALKCANVAQKSHATKQLWEEKTHQ